MKNGSFSAGIGMSLKTSLDRVGPRNHLRLPKFFIWHVSPVSCEYRSVVVSCCAEIISERWAVIIFCFKYIAIVV